MTRSTVERAPMLLCCFESCNSHLSCYDYYVLPIQTVNLCVLFFRYLSHMHNRIIAFKACVFARLIRKKTLANKRSLKCVVFINNLISIMLLFCWRVKTRFVQYRFELVTQLNNTDNIACDEYLNQYQFKPIELTIRSMLFFHMQKMK